MKVSSYAVARPAYYDRTAAAATASYGATVGPHGYTTRWTLTCAAGKKVISELFFMSVERATVAATVGAAEVVIQVNAATNFRKINTSNVANTNVNETVLGSVTLYAAETFTSLSQDASTGGTVTYVVNFKGTTFDA